MAENIDSTLIETRLFSPSPDFSQHANIKSLSALAVLTDKAKADYEGFWADLARAEITWQQPFTTVLDSTHAPSYGSSAHTEWVRKGVGS